MKAIAAKYGITVVRIHTHIGSGSDPAIWQSVTGMSLKLVEDFPQAGVLNLGGGYKVYGRACCTVCISVLKCCTVYDSVWKCVCVCVLEYVYICMYVCMCMCGCTRSMYVRDRVYYLMLHHVLSLCVESLCVARVVYVRWLDNVYQLYG